MEKFNIAPCCKISIWGHQLKISSDGFFSELFCLFNANVCFPAWKDFEGHFLKCCTGTFSQIWLPPPRTLPPAAKTCQAGASRSRGVRGHQLDSYPQPGGPAAQLATGSRMSDFLHGVTAVCTEVSATNQYGQPFNVWQGRPHLNSKEPFQCHQ